MGRSSGQDRRRGDRAGARPARGAVGDAEVIVVSEPKMGLFGRVRVEARVRARVRPVGARPRRERSGAAAIGSGRPPGWSASSARSRPRSGGEHRGSRRERGRGSNGRADRGRTGTRGTGTSRSARRRRNRSKAATAGTEVAGRLEERLHHGAVRREGSAAEQGTEGDSGHGRGNDARGTGRDRAGVPGRPAGRVRHGGHGREPSPRRGHRRDRRHGRGPRHARGAPWLDAERRSRTSPGPSSSASAPRGPTASWSTSPATGSAARPPSSASASRSPRRSCRRVRRRRSRR